MKINLIITCYNSASTVIQTLDSCFDQSMQRHDIQIIVIDDCSTDESYPVLEQYKQRQPNLLLLKNERNVGAQSSRNNALTYVNEDEYFLCVDSDDYIESNILEDMMNYIQNASLDGLCFKKTIYLRDDKYSYEISNQIHGDKVKLDDLISSEHGFLTTVNFICSKAAYTKVGGYNSRCKYDTQHFGFAVVAAGFNIGIHDGATYFARLRKESFFNQVTEKGNGNYFFVMVLWQIFHRFSDQTIMDLIADRWLEYNIRSKNQLWDYLVLLGGGHGLFIDEVSRAQPRDKDVEAFLACISKVSTEHYFNASAAEELEKKFEESEFISLFVSILRGDNNSKLIKLSTKIKNKLSIMANKYVFSKIEAIYFNINISLVATFSKKNLRNWFDGSAEVEKVKIEKKITDKFKEIDNVKGRELISLFEQLARGEKTDFKTLSKFLYSKKTDVYSSRQINRSLNLCKKIFGAQLTTHIIKEANPLSPKLFYDRRKFSPNALDNLANLSVLEAECPNLLSKAKTIAEYGGGLGESAEIIRWINPSSTYILCDTPIYSFFQFVYLSSLFPNEVMFIQNTCDAIEGKICILPVSNPDDLQNINSVNYDLVLSISTDANQVNQTDRIISKLDLYNTECAFISFEQSNQKLGNDCTFFKQLAQKGLKRSTLFIERSAIRYFTIYRR